MFLFRLLLLAEPAQLPLAPDASMSLPAGRDSLDRRKRYLEQTANTSVELMNTHNELTERYRNIRGEQNGKKVIFFVLSSTVQYKCSQQKH